MAEPAIKRLGTFLADLTHDKPPDQVHQEILDRLRDADQELDHRLAGIYLHIKDFVPIWTAIRNGVSLPASAWETVVLPVVVHFSPPQNLKPHLEAVTSLFLSARGTREIETDPTPAPASEPESLLDSLFDHEDDRDDRELVLAPLPPLPPLPPSPPDALPAKVVQARTGRRWVPQAAAVAVVGIAAVALWTGGPVGNPGGTSLFGLPGRPRVTVPSADPSPSPEAQVSESPAPAPTSAPPSSPRQPAPPSRIPGAPTSLTASKVTVNSVTLSWNAPANAATVAYYKIFKNGSSVGQPTATTDDVLNLAPATTFSFVVRAYNSDGQESPPSNGVNVTTAAPPLVFNIPTSVNFGSSFSIGGSGWPCQGVDIFIAGNRVEMGKVDEFRSFDAQIVAHERHGGQLGWVDIIGGGEMQLLDGNWPMLASCPGGPSVSKTLVVIGTPAAQPSSAPG